MSTISIFKKFTDYKGDKTLPEIIEIIKSNTYKNEIEKIRSAIKENNLELADSLKKNLLAFTASGTFQSGRKAQLLTKYSGFIILDIDKLSAEQLESVKNKAVLAPYSWAIFKSPSGNGIKIIVPVNSKAENHKEAMLQVSNYYEQALEIPIDPSGKDVSRLCFFSHDPELYYNPSADTFQVDIKPSVSVSKTESIVTNNQTSNWLEQLEKCVAFTDKVKTYQEGNRNNYIHLLACNCNRWGIPESETLQFAIAKYDLDLKEIETAVSSSYHQNSQEFGKFVNVAKIAKATNLQSQDDENPTIDFLKETPIIPESVYETLPNILVDALRAVDKPRKKDVFLTSAIVVLSGCFPEVTGIYHQERVYTHLFSFVIAPAASGKGVLKNAKRLGDKIHEGLLEASKAAQTEYEEKLFEYNQIKRTAQKAENVPPKPKEPSYKLLFIPADCSQSRMVQLLNNNDGQGIICETEADSMSGANKQDWGSYSHLLRAAFHHEKISLSRKTDNELIEIQEPRIAVALSGTPSQVPKLIASAEDGLFSRFLFYAFKPDIEWLDPSPKAGDIVHNDHFERLSKEILILHTFLSENPTNVLLTTQQWANLNKAFASKLSQVAIFTSEDAVSIVYRLGLITFRICMIFTAFRKMENGDTDVDVYCLDQDFQNALELSEAYLNHSLLIYNNLSDKDKKDDYEMPNNKKKFLAALPNEFQRKEAVEIGREFGMSARTVDSFLRSSVPSILTIVKIGHYQKNL